MGRPRKSLTAEKAITKRSDSAPAVRSDDIRSALSGVGVLGRDPREEVSFVDRSLSMRELRAMWSSDYLSAIGVESVVDDAMREGYELRIKDDAAGLADAIKSGWEDLGLDRYLRDALCFERAYGGGAILMGIDDGAQSMTDPVALKKIRGNGINWLTSIEPDELTPEEMQLDPTRPNYGGVNIWRLHVSANAKTGAGNREELVHTSRLVTFDGIRVSRRASAAAPGWGGSLLARCHTVLVDYLGAMRASGILLSDFAPLVYSVPGWAEMVAGGKADVVRGLVQALTLTQSTLRAQIIDASGTVERKATPVSGMTDLLNNLKQEVAAAFRIPVTRLMGQSPAGMNATGESDMRNYLDEVKAFQARKMRPAIEKITRILMLARGDEPENWTIQFRPLWQPTEKERAETRLIQAQADQIYMDAGVVSPEEIARSRFGGDDERFTTAIDFEARDRFEDISREPAPALPSGDV